MQRSPIPKERIEKVVKQILDNCDNTPLNEALSKKTFCELFPEWWKLTKQLVFASLTNK